MTHNSTVPSLSRFNQNRTVRFTRIIQIALLVFLGLSEIASLGIGMADSGDFTRVMTWFTSGPANLKGNWQASGTPEYDLRYFKYYIPDWKLDFPLKGIFSSVELLWLPGVLLNWLFYSQTVLSMTLVGLAPRLLNLLILGLAFRWINHNNRSRLALVLTLTLGIPLTLMLGSAAYLAYFNSFYQETGSFIFLFLFLASLVFMWRVDHLQSQSTLEATEGSLPAAPLWPRFVGLAALFLLLTSKVSNLYWIIPGVLLLIPWRRVLARPKAYISLTIGVLAMLALALILIPSRPLNRQAQAFHSLFFGSLTFSDNVQARLQEIGLEQGQGCVGRDAYSDVGQVCFNLLKDQVSFAKTAVVIWHEPAVLLRMEGYLGKFIQRLKTGLGKYAVDDPRTTAPPRTILDLWELVKGHGFPTGAAFWATLAAFAGLFIYRLRGDHKTFASIFDSPGSFPGQLALIGLLATVTCVIDMNVAILFDGQREIVKHLFLANVLFDIALIAALNLGVIYLVEWLERRRSAKV